jgi:hypothetical protein
MKLPADESDKKPDQKKRLAPRAANNEILSTKYSEPTCATIGG